MKCESSQGGDVDPAKKVQIHNDNVLLCTLREEYVVITTPYYQCDIMDISTIDSNQTDIAQSLCRVVCRTVH